jgi:catechol 2,3-dioxygenase
MSISRIGHVGLTVPDLESWTNFFTTVVGLRVVARTDDLVYLTSSHRYMEIRLSLGETYCCDAVGLDVSDDVAITQLASSAPRFGLEILSDGPSQYADRVLRVTGAHIPRLELCVGTRRAPSTYDASYATTGPRPRKLGHVTLMSSDFKHTEDVLEEYLGFRLSDSVPGEFRWYRCNSDHHGIGLGHGSDRLHHYAFALTSFEEFRLLGDHHVRNGRKLLWGPGRHGPGANIFTYYLDPGDGMVEMYTDLLQIEDEQHHRPSDFTPEQAGNTWGPATFPPEAWENAGSPYGSGSGVEPQPEE